MTTTALIALLGSGVLIVGTLLYVIHAIGSAVRSNHEERRSVTGPNGIWSTRIHWTHPRAKLGIADRVFEWKPFAGRSQDPEEEKPDNSNWWDVADLFDEFFLIVLGLIATLGVLLATLVMILLAVELAFFLLLFGLLGGLRVLFGHPWTVEIVDPDGTRQLVKVKGLRETREAHGQIRQQIEAGALKLQPHP